MLPNELMKWLLRTAQMLFQLMQQLDHPLAGIDMRIQRRIVRLLKVPPCYRSEQVCLSPQRRHVRIPDVGVELWVHFDRSPADGCAESIADEEFLFPFPVTWHGFPKRLACGARILARGAPHFLPFDRPKARFSAGQAALLPVRIGW